jgi:hypothetical protein
LGAVQSGAMIHACNRPTTGVIVQNHDRLFTQPRDLLDRFMV